MSTMIYLIVFSVNCTSIYIFKNTIIIRYAVIVDYKKHKNRWTVINSRKSTIGTI